MTFAPILDPMPGGLLQPAFPLNAGELARLLAALNAARKCGADAVAFSELSAEGQALCLRLGIEPRTGPTTLAEIPSPVRVLSVAEAQEMFPAPIPTPNPPRSCASF